MVLPEARNVNSDLFRIHKTVMEMLHDRNYDVTDLELEMSLEQFVEKYQRADQPEVDREDLLMLKDHRAIPGQKIMVIFVALDKVGCRELGLFARRVKQGGARRAILIFRRPPSNMARQFLDSTAGSNVISLQSFLDTELFINVTRHALVPPHEILTDEEKQALLRRYTLKEDQLPRIQKNDPVARYYGATPGQVFKITRPSDSAGKYATYRMVT